MGWIRASCFHCGGIATHPVTDEVFHHDGIYCSEYCLEQEKQLSRDEETEEVEREAARAHEYW